MSDNKFHLRALASVRLCAYRCFGITLALRFRVASDLLIAHTLLLSAEVRKRPGKDGGPSRTSIGLSDGSVFMSGMVSQQATEQGEALTAHCIVRVNQYVANTLGKPTPTQQCAPASPLLAGCPVTVRRSRCPLYASEHLAKLFLLQGWGRIASRGCDVVFRHRWAP